jgi:hypothetical protein
MRTQLLTAARFDSLGAPPPETLLFGRALRLDGFRALQEQPTSLSEYAAARVRHALARAPGVSDAEVLAAAAAYATHEEFAQPAPMDRLVNMCARAGATSPMGAALGLLWVRDFDAALPLALPRLPHPFLREAMRFEAARIVRKRGELASPS